MKEQMKRIAALLSLSCLVVMGLVLAGCGGGGGGGVSSQVVSGVASAGATLSGEAKLKDSSSPPREKAAVIGSDGSFAFDVGDMKAPFVLRAEGSAAGVSYTMQSFAAGTGTANINPLSNAVVASAAGVDDPAQVYSNPDPETLQKIKTQMPDAVKNILAKLQPLLHRYSADDVDPIKDRYSANHTGLDSMFDNVKISLSNGILTITNAATGAVIFSGSVTDMKNGHFTDDDNNLPQPAAIPAAPTGVTATGGTGQVILSWSAVSNATTYNLYWSTTSGVTTANGTKVAGATSPYSHTGLAAGASYYYMVTAVNSAGESAASAEVSAATSAAAPTPTAPAAPSGVQATGGTNQVTISWPAVSGATSYNLYWSTTSGVSTASGTKISSVTSPAVHSSLASGTTYYYILTAVNSAGESAPSAQVAASTLTPAPTPTVPSAPAGVTATGGTNQVTLSWSAVSGASSYNIYWSTTSGVTTTRGTKLAGVSSPYVHTGLSAGTTYYYVVTAVNSAGESAASAQASTGTAAAALDGAALYASNCQMCHGPLATSSKRKRTAAQIQAAIGSVGAMSSLSSLTSAQIQAIANALNF